MATSSSPAARLEVPSPPATTAPPPWSVCARRSGHTYVRARFPSRIGGDRAIDDDRARTTCGDPIPRSSSSRSLDRIQAWLLVTATQSVLLPSSYTAYRVNNQNTLLFNYNYTIIFLNFKIFSLMFTSQLDFAPSQWSTCFGC